MNTEDVTTSDDIFAGVQLVGEVVLHPEVRYLILLCFIAFSARQR